MAQEREILSVAPHMGTFNEGIESFRSPKAAYARGGGTPGSMVLEDCCLRYLAGGQTGANEHRPYVVVTASGQAANHLVFKGLRGGEIVSSRYLFGSTRTDLVQTFMDEGGQVEWVDPTDTQAFVDSTTDRTSAWFVEAISNPTGRVPDLELLRSASRERGIALVLDATLAVGMPRFTPLDHADIITSSLTKQAGGGRNENMGGVIIVSGGFPWLERATRFPKLRKYFADKHGDLVLPMHPFGAMLSKIGTHEGSAALAPATARSIARLLPGLEARVKRQCGNAMMLAKLMADHAAVRSVQMAGFGNEAENDERTRKYLGANHFMILADLRGGISAAERFINSGQFLHAVALGQRITAVAHPASTTHRQYDDVERLNMGIADGGIRISVGTENPGDLRHRMLSALNHA